MSESTVFEDLEMLDGPDLQAVFSHMQSEEVVAALWGAHIGLRSRLLQKLGMRARQAILLDIASCDHCTFDQVHRAQKKAVEVMCQMSRAGQIAFDAPEDMVA